MAQKYNLPAVYKGDTFNAVQFTITLNSVALDLTGYAIRCQFRRGGKTGTKTKEVSVGSGITVTTPASGVFQIDAFDCNFTPDTYYYDIEFTDASSVITTYITGTLKVIQDVTYG